MVELLDSTVATPKLRVIKTSPLRPVAKLHVTREFGNLQEKKENPVPKGEIPFEKWTMPSQPAGYIKSKDFDFL